MPFTSKPGTKGAAWVACIVQHVSDIGDGGVELTFPKNEGLEALLLEKQASCIRTSHKLQCMVEI